MVFQASALDFSPDNLDLSLVDVIAQVTDAEVIKYTRRITQ